MIFRIYLWILNKRLFKWLNNEFNTDNFKFYTLRDYFYFYYLWKNRNN